MVFTRIYNADCLQIMAELGEIADLIITSPPYNVGLDYSSYDDSIPYDQYLEWMERVWKSCYDVTRVGGRICINIPVTKQLPERKNIYVDIGHLLQKTGWKFRDNVIWYKQNVPRRTAWGSWKSPSDPYMVNPYEAVLIYYKVLPKHKKWEKADITAEEFKTWTNSFWEILPETRLSKKHPAPFPPELPRRLIKFYSYPKDVILDPFLGSGTTTMVAKELGRSSIGIEIDKGYTQLALERTFGKDNIPLEQELSNGVLYEER